MKHLYFCNKESLSPQNTAYEIKIEKPKLCKDFPRQKLTFKTISASIYWYIITHGKYRVWCAYDKEKLVHTSYVIPHCSKFPFLSKDSYEIGPCFTFNEYRGQGIYPSVLTQIVSKLDNAYMIIDENKISSIRGVEKVGFSRLPGEVKVSKFKKYIHKTGV